MKLQPSHFIALDGEAINTPDGRHLYVLLCASDGTHIYNPKGLSTKACFDYLLDLRRRHPKTIFAGFAFNYDINMMLKGLKERHVRTLWAERRLTWYHQGERYYMEWAPGKTFSLSHKESGTSLRINDVFGFYQCSFVKALGPPAEGGWGIGAPDTIARMKAARSNFTLDDIDEITAYCHEECTLLVELLERLDDALQAAGIRPSQWCGAGSIAGKLLEREGVKRYIAKHATYPEPVQEALLRSYFGGRVEVFQQGEFDRVWAYDIRSAYPSAAVDLPDARGQWIPATNLDPSNPWVVYRVRWSTANHPLGHYVSPFPYRHGGSIYYPSNGEGWYWAREVQAASNLFPDCIQVLEGWQLVPDTDAKPFSFIPRVYEERAEAKRQGHAKNVVLKLGLNATYGKLAQGYGYRNQEPPFRSFLWAGLITSTTRAKLLDLAALDPTCIVSFATDGIITTRELDAIHPTDELGGWELTKLQHLFVAQPGVYTAEVIDGKAIVKSRGFFSAELDFEAIRQGYRDNGTAYVYTSNKSRFFGIGTAVAWNDMGLRGTWRVVERKLSLTPSRKFPPLNYKVGDNPIRHDPPEVDPSWGLSEAYKPKSTGIDLSDPESFDYLHGLEQPELPLLLD